MDGWVRVLRLFNSISVISRRWEGEHERLCAMKRRLGSGRISPPAGFEPATPWSEVGSANRSATRTLLRHDKTKKVSVRPAKTQISLGISLVWSESSLSTRSRFGSWATTKAHSEYSSDQTWRMPRLIWVFAGRTSHFVGFVMRRLIYLSLNTITTGPNISITEESTKHNQSETVIRHKLNPYLPSGSVHPNQLDESISNFRGVWCTFSFLFYFE